MLLPSNDEPRQTQAHAPASGNLIDSLANMLVSNEEPVAARVCHSSAGVFVSMTSDLERLGLECTSVDIGERRFL